MVNPCIGIALVWGIFATLVAGLFALRKRTQLHPEVVRKCLHIGMGLVTLSFPWIFTATWPVMLLTVGFTFALLLRKLYPVAWDPLRPLLDQVGRTSHGEIYFALSVGIMFVCAQGNVVLFYIPFLLLTFADSAAALVGTHHGRHRYSATRGAKSLEGSLACFTVAFVCVWVSLFGRPYSSPREILVLSLAAALLATVLEVFGKHGLDNLLVPLGTFLLLNSALNHDGMTLVTNGPAALAMIIGLLCHLVSECGVHPAWFSRQERNGRPRP